MPPKKQDASVAKKTPVKKTATKRAPRAKAVPKKTPTANKANLNAQHIEENSREIKNNSSMIHIMYGIIIILMMIIAGLAFYVWQMMWKGNTPSDTPAVQTQAKDIEITIIDDERCSDCQTSAITEQLKLLPFLSEATFIEKDFSEKWVADMMKKNGLKTIPIVLFNSNNFNDGGQIAPYLKQVSDGSYSLALPEAFDPFAKRSDKGFLMLDTTILEDIKKGGYIKGNENAVITWVEYSDLECPFCARLHNDGTPKSILEKYSDDVNMVFQHFPLNFHDEALAWSQALECIAEQDSTVFYSLIEDSYKKYSNNNFSLAGFYDLAADAGIDKTELESCVDSEKYKEKVEAQMSIGQTVFGVTGTPGNVIINSKTGEYQVISGAYPASAFEAIIDKMLK